MYSGENVVILNYSEWIIQLGLYICYFLLLVLCTKLYIYSPSKAPIYLIHQTQKNWESPYLLDLELVKSDAPCSNEFTQLQLGTWSGISEYTCLCYNNKNRFFTTNKKQICKHNSENNKYKNTYICTELDKIDSEILNTYNNYKFCGKFSSKTIISYHNNLANQFITSSSIDYYSTPFPIDEKGIIDIKIIKKGNEYDLEKTKFDRDSINIYEFNDFITGIHYSNELICASEEMNNINPINNYFKNSRNVYYSNIKQCLLNKNNEYKNYYIDDTFVRTSIIDKDNLIKKNEIYEGYSSITNYYKNINEKLKVDILNYKNNYPILVAQRYLYGIGCQFYEKTNYYFTLLNHFYHNKNIALSIIVFTLITSVTAVIFVSFNLYQNCVDYPTVFLIFSIILVSSLVIDMTLTGVYLGYSYYLKYSLGRILNECRIDFYGQSNQYNYYNYYSYNKALPIEIGLYEDLNYVVYLSLVMTITEVVVLILIIIYFIFNCYRYTFVALRNESGQLIKTRKRKKKDLMDLVKMI
jgi:hypothetical protein